jgi:hypothetical protein
MYKQEGLAGETEMQMFELVEIDPDAPEDDNEILMSPRPGTWAQIKAHMDSIIEDMNVDFDHDGPSAWAMLRIQPAA